MGAVLIQKDSQGISRPVIFASNSLTPPETRYANIDYEMLAVVFDCMRFHHYFLVESSYARVTSLLMTYN